MDEVTRQRIEEAAREVVARAPALSVEKLEQICALLRAHSDDGRRFTIDEAEAELDK